MNELAKGAFLYFYTQSEHGHARKRRVFIQKLSFTQMKKLCGIVTLYLPIIVFSLQLLNDDGDQPLGSAGRIIYCFHLINFVSLDTNFLAISTLASRALTPRKRQDSQRRSFCGNYRFLRYFHPPPLPELCKSCGTESTEMR